MDGISVVTKVKYLFGFEKISYEYVLTDEETRKENQRIIDGLMEWKIDCLSSNTSKLPSGES